jgi:hypothetical protein
MLPWVLCDEPTFDWFTYDYEVVHEPKFRPYVHDEIQPCAMFRAKGWTKGWTKVIEVSHDGIWMLVGGEIKLVMFKELAKEWETSVDYGNQWCPCGVCD